MWVGVLTRWKCVGGVRVYFYPLEMSYFFHSKLLLDHSASFTSSRMKGLWQKWKVKLIFLSAYRLSGTGDAECLEIVDVGCNLKQFDGLTWLTLTPIFYDRFTPLEMTLYDVLIGTLNPHSHSLTQVPFPTPQNVTLSASRRYGGSIIVGHGWKNAQPKCSAQNSVLYWLLSHRLYRQQA